MEDKKCGRFISLIHGDRPHFISSTLYMTKYYIKNAFETEEMSGRQRRRKHETQLFSALNLIFWIFFFQRVWSANLEVFQKLLVILIGLNGTKVRKSPKQILIYFPLANWFFMGYTFMYYNLALWIDMKIHVKATEQDVEILSSIIFIEPNPLSLWGEYFS